MMLLWILAWHWSQRGDSGLYDILVRHTLLSRSNVSEGR